MRTERNTKFDTEAMETSRETLAETDHAIKTEIWESYEEQEWEAETTRLQKMKQIKPTKAALQTAAALGLEEPKHTGPLASFFVEELIVGEPVVVKSGKEATVYCCEAHPSVGRRWLAGKVYRPRQQRSFKKDGIYQQGRTTFDARLDRAIASHSKKGLETQFRQWIDFEYATLRKLHAAGADVPQPYGSAESALLIEYFGEIGMSAPQLAFVTLQPHEVRSLYEQMLMNLAIFLDCDRVHGDLSSYNILYWEGRLQIIDLPQAVDPLDNPDAFDLFARDVENVCTYFADYGIRHNPHELAVFLWMESGRARPRQVR